MNQLDKEIIDYCKNHQVTYIEINNIDTINIIYDLLINNKKK